MAGDAGPHGARDDQTDLAAHLAAELSKLDPASQRALRLALASGLGSPGPFEPTPPSSRRRPRRPDVVAYRVRVDLVGTKPPLWRRLELASDLFLDDVHDILQVAFGWTDSHLHRFASGSQHYGPDTEYYLCPFDLEDDEVGGVPEHEVRLDEVLVDDGDRLSYLYDYGDAWEHTLELEAVLPREGAAPRAVCTGGRRAGPAEDCGGLYCYELIAAATDPTHPDHVELAAEFARFYGEDVDAAHFDTTPFDLDEINRLLADLGFAEAAARGPVPEPLAELVGAVSATPSSRRLGRLVADAQLDEQILPDSDTMTRMVAPYTWLLDRVGTDGIKLTGAGYLPPAHVEAAVDALGLDEWWIGKGNREIQTTPVLYLRESAQGMGLLRKHRGSLRLTARSRALRTDPVALWWHVAEQTPPKSNDACEVQAGLIVLVAVAALATDELSAIVADLLDAIGWMSSDGTALTEGMAAQAARDTTAVLRWLGALGARRDHRRDEQPTPEGVAFARAALRTWPDA